MTSKKWVILLPSLLIILLASGVGITSGSFVDSESSNGNTFQAWASTQWLQTTKVHFDAGVLTNVDTSSSPNDVKLAVKSDWYNASWQYRRAITLSAATSVSNYQVLVTLTTAIMGNPYAHVKSDGSDIRFTGPDGITLQDYWIESWSNTNSSKIWVEVANSGTSTIYMYYGNSGATSISSGTATFEFFDDFENGNLNKWTVVTGGAFWSVVTSRAHTGTYSMRAGTTSSTDRYIAATGLNQANVIFDAWWYNTATTPDISQNVRARTALPLNDYHINWEGQWTIAEMPWNPLNSVAGSLPQNSWFKMTVIIQGTSMKVLKDDVQLNPVSGWLNVGTKYASGSIGFRAWTANSNWWIDDVRVRKYAATEPTTSVGSEEGMYVLSGTIASQVLDTGVGSARWNALFWDRTLDTGTSITFEVRAANSLVGGFPDASWIPVGGTSPVISGLPSGKYMQWQATLTTSDSSKTPTLHEVRVYHY